jgi:NO-binding membrane sensor protein with MHYT domain
MLTSAQGGADAGNGARHRGVAGVVTVHSFSYGLLNPVLGYAMACVGSFLGLRCMTLARLYYGLARARWLSLAALSIGATGIWAMHFIAMLGFAIPGRRILYNVPMTIGSLVVAVVVVGIGLFVVGFGYGVPARLLTGGVIVGAGVASTYYLGMAAMSMADSMSYGTALVAVSVLIAIAAGLALVWAGTRVRGLVATVGASLIMGAAISGTYYTGTAALQVHPGSMPSMAVTAVSGVTAVPGATAAAFLLPVLLVIGIATFITTLTLCLSPGEGEIRANAEMRRRMEYLQQRHG